MTALAWHPRHADLFAAGYGSYDFLRQAGGSVACFTLKNPSQPECLLTTSSGGDPKPCLNPELKAPSSNLHSSRPECLLTTSPGAHC